jgi:hypothetical protein
LVRCVISPLQRPTPAQEDRASAPRSRAAECPGLGGHGSGDSGLAVGDILSGVFGACHDGILAGSGRLLGQRRELCKECWILLPRSWGACCKQEMLVRNGRGTNSYVRGGKRQKRTSPHPPSRFPPSTDFHQTLPDSDRHNRTTGSVAPSSTTSPSTPY